MKIYLHGTNKNEIWVQNNPKIIVITISHFLEQNDPANWMYNDSSKVKK